MRDLELNVNLHMDIGSVRRADSLGRTDGYHTIQELADFYHNFCE